MSTGAPAEGAPHCVVIGAGIAGLSAAYSLTRAGASVTLVEADDVVGGRWSTRGSTEFEHRGAGWTFPVEHGLHGVWRHYDNLRRLIGLVAPSCELVEVADQDFLCPDHRGRLRRAELGARMRATRLPEPFSTLAFLRVPFIVEDLVRSGGLPYVHAGLDLVHLIGFDAERDSALYDALCAQDMIGRWPPVLQHLFGALAHSGFFDEPSEVSLSAFLHGLGYYVSDDRRNSRFSVLADVTQVALLDALLASIGENGRVLRGRRARAVCLEAERVHAVEIDRRDGSVERLDADAVVLALDPAGMRALCRDATLRRALGEPTIPHAVASVAVRLWYARATEQGATSGVMSGVAAQNFFWLHRLQRPFRHWHRETGGSVLELHLYGDAARRAAHVDDADVIGSVDALVARAWPELAGTLVHGHLQRNPSTHPAFGPGCVARAPRPATAIENLALCGDWIAAPWPALYLERACVTGLVAAQTVAAALGLSAERLLRPTPPAPVAPGVRLLRPVVRELRDRGLLFPVGGRGALAAAGAA